MDTTEERQPYRRLEFEHEEDLTVELDQEEPTNVCVDDEVLRELHSKVSEDIIPKVGMEFENEDAAYDFYNAYAFAVGFSIRRSSAHNDPHKGTLVDRKFVCSCEGTRAKDKREALYKSHRPETRFCCLARLKISCRHTGKYRVVAFIATHTHNLASPSKSHLFRSHRKVSSSQASVVDMADMSGIAPRNAYEFMAREAGGRESLGFSQVDYRNYLRTKRSSQMMPGDTGGVLEYLQSMKEEDPGFFYALQVDVDGLITNIFWADAKMVAAYEDFGDVVCFDTTYRKHKDARPIGMFVGVNHHNQTTVFGAALLYDETSDSFVWLFDTFARAMSAKLPKTLLTDQDVAMSKALAIQWPNTRHRLCIWHIFQNAATHLSSVFARHKDFLTEFSNCVYDFEHEEDFLDAWSTMLERYELQDNEWLKRMFGIKEKWALVYGRETFCADMITTQRSESMNKLLKHYVSSNHQLRRFFEHFQRLVYDRRYGEMVADFKTSQSKVVLAFPVEILKHAESIYTHEVFKMFQNELFKSYDCLLESIVETREPMEFMVTPPNKHYSYVVSYNGIEEDVSCTCRKFEFAGLLCSHILKVFSSKNVTKLPSKYVLKRWTKDARKGSCALATQSSSSDMDPKIAMGGRYKDLCRQSTRLVTKAAESEDGYALVKESLAKLMKELDLISIKDPEQSSLQICNTVESDLSCDISVDANHVVETVRGLKEKPKPGNRSSKRLKGALEKIRKKTARSKAKSPMNPKKKKQIVQLDENDPQRSFLDDIHPQDPFGYSCFASSEYRQGDPNITPILSQPTHQFPLSHMALLASIGTPLVKET